MFDGVEPIRSVKTITPSSCGSASIRRRASATPTSWIGIGRHVVDDDVIRRGVTRCAPNVLRAEFERGSERFVRDDADADGHSWDSSKTDKMGLGRSCRRTPRTHSGRHDFIIRRDALGSRPLGRRPWLW